MDYHIASWNLENLFDIEGSPRRSDKLQRVLAGELKGWSSALLDKKIAQLASIIAKMNGGLGPDLLGVYEVENRYVLDLLTAALGQTRNYTSAHHDMSDHRGIDVAFIYDPALFTAQQQFSHFIIKRTATRDLFQVNFRTAAGQLLVAVGNHWPSRSGGQFETEAGRIIAGENLAYFHQRIREEHGENTAIVAMGDFNDEPSDRAVATHAQSGRELVRAKNATTVTFFNLMWPVLGRAQGTFYFENWPLVFDQLMVSEGVMKGSSGFSLVPGTVPEVIRFPEMMRGRYQVPRKFGRGKKVDRDGFSDHFPVAFFLREAQ